MVSTVGRVQETRTHLCAHLQLDDLDLVCNDGWFIPLVECVVEHLDRICVKLVGKAGPLEGERHDRVQCNAVESRLGRGHRVGRRERT